MKLFLSIASALVVLGASPALAGQPHGGQSGCRIGCSPYGGANINVNANSYASAHAESYARSGGYVDARAYDVRYIGPRPAWVTVSSSEYYSSLGGYGHAYAPVYVSGPGYGPSRPFGYAVEGFGRRYATTDRCNSGCGYPPPPPPPCDCPPGGAHYDHSSYGSRSGSSYSVRESYSESYGGARYAAPRYEATRYAAPVYRAPVYEAPRYAAPVYEAPVYEAPVYPAPRYEPPVYEQPVYEAPRYEAPRFEAPHYEAPRYEPRPYFAAPLEPVEPDYAPPPVYYSQAEPQPHVAPEPRPYHPAPRPPLGYHGDLPPGDTGQGRGIPYRQEPGERG